jgi:hypothetical protein
VWTSEQLLLVTTVGEQLRSDGVDGHDVDVDVFGGQFGCDGLAELVRGFTNWRQLVAVCFLV